MTGATEGAVTTVADLKQIQEGDKVTLPPFPDGTPFVARLRRPSLIRMAQLGQIPNPLLLALDDLMEVGRDEPRSSFLDRLELLIVVAAASLEEPKYEEVKDYIDPLQLLAIWAYVNSGVDALIPFRALRELFASRTVERAVEIAPEPDAGA